MKKGPWDRKKKPEKSLFSWESWKELLGKHRGKSQWIVACWGLFSKCHWNAAAVPCRLAAFHGALPVCQRKDLFWKVFCFQGIQLLRKQFTLGSKIPALNCVLYLAHRYIKLNKWSVNHLTKFPKKMYTTTGQTGHLLRLQVKNSSVCVCLEYKDSNGKWFPAKFYCLVFLPSRIQIIPGKIFSKNQLPNFDITFGKKRWSFLTQTI